jgi:hypothetical protein
VKSRKKSYAIFSFSPACLAQPPTSALYVAGDADANIMFGLEIYCPFFYILYI